MRYLTNLNNIHEQLKGLTGKKEKHLERSRNVVVLSAGVPKEDQHEALRIINNGLRAVQNQGGGNSTVKRGILANLNIAKHNVENLDYGEAGKGSEPSLPGMQDMRRDVPQVHNGTVLVS